MKVYIAAHRRFDLPPGLPSFYSPLQVGAALHEPIGWPGDDTGDTISADNPTYNELTALYWMWKNSTEDIVGLCHYRRYFVTPRGKLRNLVSGAVGDFLTEETIRRLLKNHDWILHNPTFFAQGVGRQFEQTQSAANLAVLRQVVAEQGPAYADAFDRVMKGHTVHLLNMFIAPKPLADRYAAWLFAVLRETERRIRARCPDAPMDRAMGMLGERMPDVWARANGLRTAVSLSVNTERIDRTPW